MKVTPPRPDVVRTHRTAVGWKTCVSALVVTTVWGCSAPRDGVDLLASARTTLFEASVNGRNAQQVRAEVGRPLRIRGVVQASLPATPSSRLRFVADVPRAGRLVLAAGIPARHHGETAVEFVVKVRHRGRETTVLSRLVDPANRKVDRAWVPLEADLSWCAGRGVEIILETRGFDRTDDSDRAFWGTPAITTVEDRDAPLVIVYLVDTLRADHLPLYGYERDTAPELGRFALDSVVFDQAIASSSWTMPSVASLFTSLRPSAHGCVQFFTPLDPSFVTLAERLRDSGYGTGAVVANSLVLSKNAHFDQGFTYFAPPPEPERAEQAVDAALAFLHRRQGLPTFLYVHAMDPHSPYAPPSPFDRRFGPPPAAGRAAAEPSDYQEPLDRDRIVGQYDGEVAYGDRAFGRFVGELRARRLYERALIVFVSDHGEEFLDHGDWVHGHTLFDELVRVPLVVKFQGQQHAGRRVERQVELLDVLPTILKSQGIALPNAPMIAGRPLEESLAGAATDRPATFEAKYREFVSYGARTRVEKYVRQLHPEDRESYFDLVRDPGEQVNRIGEPGRGQELKRIAEAAVGTAVFSYKLRVAGDEPYELHVRTAGWIERIQAVGLGSSERAELEDGRQRLLLILRPQRARPREVTIVTRPHGVPLWITGTRDGRALRPGDIRFGADAVRAGAVPFQFPDVEDAMGAFSPPRTDRAGIAAWIEPLRPGQTPQPDNETLGRLRALGYVR